MRRLDNKNNKGSNKIIMLIASCITLVLLGVMFSIIIVSVPNVSSQEFFFSLSLFFFFLLIWWIVVRKMNHK